MARLFSGNIGTNSAHIRYIAGGSDSENKYNVFYSQYPTYDNVNLKVDYLEKINKYKLSVPNFSKVVKIKSSFQKDINTANSIDFIPYAEAINNRLYVWILGPDGKVIVEFYVDFKSIDRFDIKKIDKNNSFPKKKKKKEHSINNATLPEPHFIIQDIQYSEDFLEFVSEDVRFLFDKKFLDRLFNEINHPTNKRFESLIQSMSALEIIQMIKRFNNHEYKSISNPMRKLIAPTRWLWDHAEYDGLHLAEMGWWCTVIDDLTMKATIQEGTLDDGCLDRYEDEGYMWDEEFLENTMYFVQYTPRNNQIIPDSHVELLALSPLVKKFEDASIKYLKSLNLHRMDIGKVNKMTATYCAYVMKLLIDDNQLGLTRVLGIINP